MAKSITKRKKKIICVVCVMLLVFVAGFVLFEAKARDLIHNLVGNELEILATAAIDRAVADVLCEADITYESLVNVASDGSGIVRSLSTDSLAINKLKADLSLRINDKIKNDRTTKVSVPAGAFTGLVLLSQQGPDISVSLTFGGSVITNIKSEFVSAGINQTMHRIYMTVVANVSLTCPIIEYETFFETDYEICQTIIVGDTPQFMAGGR